MSRLTSPVNRGVLYKALNSSQFLDQGDDPTNYTDDFKQITMRGSQDLQPVIDLVRWVTSSSDSEFDAHLTDHIDVPAFARYLAAQNLLLNSDDMAGPGRNYYLWYDLAAKKFTIIGWDYNLAFGGNATLGPHDNTSRAGAFGPDNGTAPQGFPPANGAQPPGMQPQGGIAGGFGTDMGGNKLKERFLASPAFKTVYDQAYRELYANIYADGAATNALDRIANVLSTVAGYDPHTDTSGQQLRTIIQQRTKSLASDPVMTTG